MPGDPQTNPRARRPQPSATSSSRSLPLELASTRTPRATAPGVVDQWKTLAPQAALGGEFARALDLYRSLAAVEPNVPLHRIRAGDCLVKMGQKREALGEYRVAADAYLALGMQVHARSAWRLVLGIVPGDADATARLRALDARARGAKAGTPPPVPSTAGAIPAPAPRADAPGRATNTPTAPEAEVRAELAAARAAAALVIVPAVPTVPVEIATALSKAPERSLEEVIREALANTPVPARIAKSQAITPVVARRADVRGPVERAVTPAPSAAELRALEFADLDDDDDGIWIDLDGLFDAPANAPQPLVPAGYESTEPVAFFAATDDGEESPARQSGPAQGPRASIVDEETKPVPPPDL